jgi:hypothetical protein
LLIDRCSVFEERRRKLLHRRLMLIQKWRSHHWPFLSGVFIAL